MTVLVKEMGQSEGEHHTRELSAQQPEIAKRLRAKLKALEESAAR